MSNTQDPIHALVREAGGIVHSDGNIFFTNKEQFRKAAESLQSPAPQPQCDPTQTECGRCKNDVTKCDGAFAAQPPGDAREASTTVQRWMQMIDYAYNCRDDIRDSGGNTPRSNELRLLANEMIAALQAAAQAIEPSADIHANSETLPGECWKNPLFPLETRLQMADGAVAFERKLNANLRARLDTAPAQASEPSAEVECVWNDPSKATVLVMHGHQLRNGQKLYAAPARAVEPLTVLYRAMPESCGRTNWTASLFVKGKGDFTIARSEYPHRVRYEADRVRWLIGELDKEPFILDYDADEQTPCHLCGGTGDKDGKPCHGLNFKGPVHHDITTTPAAKEQTPTKLWLWKNFVDGKPEYWAFDNAFPVYPDSDDPQTLGEPCGYALVKPSRAGRPGVSDEEVLRRVAAAKEQS